MRVIVIGAGLGGLSAACHLRADGHDVVVVESAGAPGGCATITERNGYRFNAGPTVFTMPHLLDRCFDAVGAQREERVDLRRVDPLYRCCFADGSELRVRSDRHSMTDEIARECGTRDAEQFAVFVEWLTRLYDLEMPGFIERNYDGVLDLARPLGPALSLVRLGAFRRLSTTMGRYFDDERLQRVFSFQSLYAGLAPQQALSIYAVIAYMDSIGGVFSATGGMGAIAAALAGAAGDAGVEFHYDARASRIERHSNGAVAGVQLVDGTKFAADAVVANADVAGTYRDLLPTVTAPRVVRKGEYSPSAVVWHVGTAGALPPRAAHHNIHFGTEWAEAFDALLRQGRRMPDPSLLVSVASLDDPSLAPPGRHGLYVLEPVPNLDSPIEWRTERPRARADLARRLAAFGYPVGQADIEAEILMDPEDWRAAGFERGTPFSLSHRFSQTGPFRPRNVERRVPGLVLTGAGTVPGVGIPMVLISGMLAAERVRELSAKAIR